MYVGRIQQLSDNGGGTTVDDGIYTEWQPVQNTFKILLCVYFLLAILIPGKHNGELFT